VSLSDFRERRDRKNRKKDRQAKYKNQLDLFECVDCGCKMELVNLKASVVNSFHRIERELALLRGMLF
jgi:Zn ribbon nucleic-acid-binding protein